MITSDELFGEGEDDSLRPAIPNGRDRQDERGNLCNFHAAAASYRRLCAARGLRRYFFCYLLEGGGFCIVRFRISAQLSEFVFDRCGLLLRRKHDLLVTHLLTSFLVGQCSLAAVPSSAGCGLQSGGAVASAREPEVLDAAGYQSQVAGKRGVAACLISSTALPMVGQAARRQG